MSEFFKNVSEGQNWKPEPYQRYNAVNALLSQFGATGTGHAARSIADRAVFTAVNRDEKAFQEGIAVEALSAEMEDGELVPVKTSGTGTAALWGVALASLEPGDIGPVLLSGVAAVRLSAALPAGTKFVEPGDGGSFEAASGGRAQVIASQGNTALVLLGGAGAEEPETVLCKVTGQSGIGYSVDFYANGRESPSTGSGVLFATELALVGTLPEGSWILGHKTAVQITGGGES